MKKMVPEKVIETYISNEIHRKLNKLGFHQILGNLQHFDFTSAKKVLTISKSFRQLF